MDNDIEPPAQWESIRQELMNVGFSEIEINKTQEWLENLSAQSDYISVPGVSAIPSIRLFCAQETDKLDLECQGFLLFLEQCNIIDPQARELIIDRFLDLDTEDIGIEQLRWVILLVLLNQPGQEAACAWLEDLIYEMPLEYLH